MSEPRKRMLPRLRPRRRAAPGSSPGTLIADPSAPPPRTHVFAYGPDRVLEEELTDPARVEELTREWPVVWVNVEGLGDVDLVRRLGALFDLHPLALEDVLNVHQRAKLEPYERHLFLVLRMVSLGEHVATEQMSVFFDERFVLTFQERAGDCLDPVRQRIRKARGRIRTCGADYLAYAIVDAVVDHYFPILERLGEQLEGLEEEIVAGHTGTVMERLYALKRDLVNLRRAIFPLREALSLLARGDVGHVSKETQLYFRDCHDHSFQVLEVLELARETASSLMDLYLNSLSQRMNEVMMVLTIIATIFIPLSFIAGLYGMNFDGSASPWNMPELRWPWGYPAVLGLMALVAGGMLAFFWRRGWLGSRPADAQRGEPSR